MSNNTNLSTLANVLDDGSSGQFLKSTGSGGVVFDAVAAGTTTVADITALEALTAAQGDMAFVLSNDNVYIRKTAGWYKIAQVTNNQLESVTVTMSGGGTAGTPYALALDGTDTTATGAATDPEGLSVTWSAAAISPTTLSGNNIVVSSVNVATITQGTGASSNVFTIDPTATTGTHNFSLRFSVTDGVNATINTDKTYTLNFVTTVTDSKYTVLLAEGQGAGNNKTITDSSSSPNTLTISGSPVAGAFSPYREGGYSLFFDGTGDALTIPQTSNVGNFGTGTFTVEFWFQPTNADHQQYFVDFRDSNGAGFQISRRGNNTVRVRNGSVTLITGTTLLTDLNTWYHVLVHRNSNNDLKLYVNGSVEGTLASHTDNYSSPSSGNWMIAQDSSASNRVYGYMTDVRVTHGEAITPPSGGPTDRLATSSNTKFLYSGTGYIGDTHSTTVSNNHTVSVVGDSEVKPVGPYDSEEYDAADNGGSIFFNGDHVLGNSGTNLGTGDWTIQSWVYPNAASQTHKIVDFRPQSNGTYVMLALRASDAKFQFYADSSNQIISDDEGFANTWTHVALVRHSGTIKMYVNGRVQSTTVSSSSNYLSSSARPAIGANGMNNSSEINAYLGDLKVTIGTAEYTANFIPPTAPISSSNAEVHLKGTDAKILDKNGSSSLDLLGSTFPVGDSTSVTYGGSTIYSSKSFSMTGATGEYIQVPSMVKLEGDEDFSMECWVYPTNISSYQVIFSHGELRLSLGNYQSRNRYSIYLPNKGFNFDYDTDSTYSIPNNAWSFLQLVRDGSSGTKTWKAYLNGSQVWGTTEFGTQSVSTTTTPCIGATPTGGERFKGKLQGLRVSKGIVRPTTVPTAPFKG